MEVPAQPGLHSGPLPDQVLSVIDEQLELTGDPIQAGHWQVGLAQGGPRHGHGVDGIGLSLFSGAPPLAGHEPGGHSNH